MDPVQDGVHGPGPRKWSMDLWSFFFLTLYLGMLKTAFQGMEAAKERI